MILRMVIAEPTDVGLVAASFSPRLMSTRTVRYLVEPASSNTFLLARLDASAHEFSESYFAE